ncbi:MAG: DUF805 domain-containing protein [Prevotellaceae bacterium]|jgi:uncharacterized membrane protein YhaH (DUF805 family)|nr:DUF805 domain-containing protein [Prevotellaceae bacterium]
MKWYLKVWRQYADFSGRARRTEYWMFYLLNVLFTAGTLILGYALALALGSMEMIIAVTVLIAIYYLAIFIPNLAVLVRRLHDIGKGGGWIFISLIPLIGTIWLLILLFTEGEHGENRFGPNPKLTDDSAPRNRYEPTNSSPPQNEHNHRETRPVAPIAQQEQITVGRDYACDIRVDDQYEDVSRNHATLRKEGSVITFEDHSTNGTHINGRILHHSKQPVQYGDQIVLGRKYMLSWNDIGKYFPNLGRSRDTQRK